MNPAGPSPDPGQDCAILEAASDGSRKPRRFSPLRLLVSLLVSAAIVFVLLRLTHVSPGQILGTLKRTSPAAILIGLFLHLATYGLRCLRFRLLVHSKKVALSRLFDIVMVHNVMNHILPLRAGELTYVYLIRQREGVPLAEGLGTLVISRFLDLIAFTVYYPLAVLLLQLQGFSFPPYIRQVLWIVAALFLLLTALLLAISLKGRVLLDGLRRFLLRGILCRSRLVNLLFDKLEEVSLSFEHLGAWKVYLGGLALSLGILGLVYLIGYVLLAGMGYPMPFPLVIFCSTLANLCFVLPLYSFGGFGTLEAGWTVGCLMAGFSKEMGMASGFTFHILVLLYVSLIGFVGMLRIGAPRWIWAGRDSFKETKEGQR